MDTSVDTAPMSRTRENGKVVVPDIDVARLMPGSASAKLTVETLPFAELLFVNRAGTGCR